MYSINIQFELETGWILGWNKKLQIVNKFIWKKKNTIITDWTFDSSLKLDSEVGNVVIVRK